MHKIGMLVLGLTPILVVTLQPQRRRDWGWLSTNSQLLVTLLEFRLLTTPCHFLRLIDLCGSHA